MTHSEMKKFSTGPQWNPLYKSRLCEKFQTEGHCPYTSNCQFAHGREELERWEHWRTKHHYEKPVVVVVSTPPPEKPPAVVVTVSPKVVVDETKKKTIMPSRNIQQAAEKQPEMKRSNAMMQQLLYSPALFETQELLSRLRATKDV